MTTALQSPDQMLVEMLIETLPPETVAALMAYPDIAAELASVLDQPPFAADYVPRAIEVLFDDVTVLQWQDGQMTHQGPSVAVDYQPELVEWLMDGETAYFSVKGLEVINRLKTMPRLDIETLESLKEDVCKPS